MFLPSIITLPIISFLILFQSKFWYCLSSVVIIIAFEFSATTYGSSETVAFLRIVLALSNERKSCALTIAPFSQVAE